MGLKSLHDRKINHRDVKVEVFIEECQCFFEPRFESKVRRHGNNNKNSS